MLPADPGLYVVASVELRAVRTVEQEVRVAASRIVFDVLAVPVKNLLSVPEGRVVIEPEVGDLALEQLRENGELFGQESAEAPLAVVARDEAVRDDYPVDEHFAELPKNDAALRFDGDRRPEKARHLSGRLRRLVLRPPETPS